MLITWLSTHDEWQQREVSIAFIDDLFQHTTLSVQAKFIEDTMDTYDENLFEILFDVIDDFVYHKGKLLSRLYHWEHDNQGKTETEEWA